MTQAVSHNRFAKLPTQNKRVDPRIGAILDNLTQRNLGKRIQWSQVAASVNMSTSRWRHIFTREVGESPGRYLKILRLQTAKILLQTSFLTMKEIMALVGIHSHFARDFKRLFGQTPSRFRRHALRCGISLPPGNCLGPTRTRSLV
jgi:transcriptional regulator GlxA family with amidase domain